MTRQELIERVRNLLRAVQGCGATPILRKVKE